MATIDETTGLPQLPEGMFWRITKPNIIGNHEIQLRKKLFIGSVKLEYGQVPPGAMRPGRIYESAAWALAQLNVSKQGAPFIGDYPPKRLNDWRTD